MDTANLLLAISLIGGCGFQVPAASSSSPAASSPSENGFSARVVQQLDGSWSTSYQFDRPRSALLFDSSGDYRTANWTPTETQGIRIENLYGLDVLLLDPPSSEVQFSVRPQKGIVQGGSWLQEIVFVIILVPQLSSEETIVESQSTSSVPSDGS